jgi:formylglycine-generating enzyme required for sulfatase activity
MKCSHCNRELNIDADISSLLSYCPFCGKSLAKEEEPKSYENSKDALAAIMNKHGYRLPTEAEWEYTARGGDDSPGNFTYSGSNNIDEVAWYEGNSGEKIHPVGTKKANVLGLYDMSGNVWEWCWDWYGDYSGKAEKDPVGVSSGSGRVIRGGSWNDSVSNQRSTFRGGNHPSNRNAYIGFRLVCPQ